MPWPRRANASCGWTAIRAPSPSNTTPVIRAVRDMYPDAFIAYLGEKEAVSLLEHNPALNEMLNQEFEQFKSRICVCRKEDN